MRIVVKRPTRFSTLIDDAQYTYEHGEAVVKGAVAINKISYKLRKNTIKEAEITSRR